MHFVIEILGRPADHVKEALNTIVVKIGSEQGVKIIEQKYHDPIPVKESKDLFTAFAEVVAELDSIMNYFGIIFAYLPAHIEIIKPENLSFISSDFNDVGNRLVQRLHDYDAITKKVLMERDMLLEKLKEVAPELFETEKKRIEDEVKNAQKLAEKVNKKKDKKGKKPKAKKPKN